MIFVSCEFTQVSTPEHQESRPGPSWNRPPIVTTHTHNATEIPMIRAQWSSEADKDREE